MLAILKLLVMNQILNVNQKDLEGRVKIKVGNYLSIHTDAKQDLGYSLNTL